MERFKDKTQEIGYALMRIAVYIRRKDLRSRIENLGMELIEAVALSDVELALGAIAAANELVKLGVSIYEVETINARTIINELRMLELGIRQAYGLEQLPDIQTLFSKSAYSASVDAEMRQSLEDAAIYSEQLPDKSDDTAIRNTAGSTIGNQSAIAAINAKSKGEMVSIGTTIRQSAILNKVREMTAKDINGNLDGCRMKDLLAAFPDVSERTLRNDLQRLMGQGIIKRVGNGGPSAFYVMN